MTRTPEQILCCPRGCIMLANECCAVTRSNQTAGNGTQHFSVLMQMPLPDRLTLARALLPDGWVVMKDVGNVRNLFGPERERWRAEGWNACRAAMLASGEETP